MKKVIGLFVCVCMLAMFPGVSLADYSSTVKTPKGSAVSVRVITSEFSSKEIASVNATYQKAYPKAKLLRSASKKYNCHSYAWYSQSTSNNVWMDDPTKYMTDGSYAGFCSVNPPSGYKVNYPGTHSAISVGNGIVQSKWGQAPLMEHGITYGPAVYKMNCYRSYKRN